MSGIVQVQDVAADTTANLRLLENRAVIVTATRGGQSVHIGGLWTLEADNPTVCIDPSPLGGVAIPMRIRCFPVAGHAAGDQWSAQNEQNQIFNITLIAP